MADVVALGSAAVMPNLVAESRVNGPNIVGSSEIQNAVYFEWRGLESVSWSAESPSERERTDVLGIDLVERAEAPAGIVAVVGGPGVCGRFEQGCGVKRLRGSARRR